MITMFMDYFRRNKISIFSLVFFATLQLGYGTANAASDTCSNEPPSASDIESGDLIWPKKPGIIIPYHAGEVKTLAKQKKDWETGKAELIDRLKKVRNTPDAKKEIEKLQALSFRQFRKSYLADVQPNAVVPYDTGTGWVGHIAMILKEDDGTFSVVEALGSTPNPGDNRHDEVISTPYETWIKVLKENGYIFYHGRILDLSAEGRHQSAQASKSFLGQPYYFFNLNLDDESNFYCSKLIWLSVFKATGKAIDSIENPERWIWLSPKQIMNLNRVDVLNKPCENY